MRRLIVMTVVLGLVSTAYADWHYPKTRTVDASDTYFGKTYKDPLRWLENLQDKEVEAWFKAQAELTDGVLAKIPARDKLAEEWLALDKLKSASYREIAVEHGRVFYKKTLSGENVGKIYRRDGWNGAETLVFDPATFRPRGAVEGSPTTVGSFVPSPDGRRVALALTSSGSEWAEVRVLDVESGKLLPDSLYPSWGTSSWTLDSKGLFYDGSPVVDTKSKDIELNRQVRLHILGTPVEKDVDLLSNASHPELGISAKEWPSGVIDQVSPKYLQGSVSTVQEEMRLYVAPATLSSSNPKPEWRELIKLSDNISNRGALLRGKHIYALTHEGAPHYKLVRTLIDKPAWKTAETVIPEADDTIDTLVGSKNFLFAVYTNGVRGRVVKYDVASGKSSELKLPISGTVEVRCPDATDDVCVVSISSWARPMTAWDYDANKDTFAKSAFNIDVTYPGFDNLVSEEVEVPSHDGTLVPLSIIHRKDLALDGKSSAIMEGYGAYGYSITPWFNVMDSVALHGVVVAYCHPRGGGEKGAAWYKAGFKTTKPNTWKDFIACGDYLVKKGYTSPAHLTGTGTSAGGILITRAITERPDLFAAAVVNVGVANAMRAEFSPNGPVNTPEFGTVANEAEAAALFEMDGVQHVVAGTKYPAVLGVAGWNDPRVAPWEPGKFVAAVQAANKSAQLALLKVNYDNGHFTEEKLVTYKDFAGQYAFLLWQAGNKEFQPTP